jgi:hypothetical protein
MIFAPHPAACYRFRMSRPIDQYKRMSNLGDTSFLDGIGGPGWVVEQIGDGAHDGRIVGSDGKTVSGSGTVNSVGGLTHSAWLSHEKLNVHGGLWVGANAYYFTQITDGRIDGKSRRCGLTVFQLPEHGFRRQFVGRTADVSPMARAEFDARRYT